MKKREKYRIKRKLVKVYIFKYGEFIGWFRYQYAVQMRTAFGWRTIKVFNDSDEVYSFIRAKELLDMLNENL